MLNKSLHNLRKSARIVARVWRALSRRPIVATMLASPHADLVASLSPAVRNVAREAGSLALASFRSGALTTAKLWYKNRGASPVTAADMAVDSLLKERLSEILPDAGWLSEETADSADRLTRRLVWIVDPIDGTRAFMSGHPDWCVAIGLLADGRPIFGLVYAPAHEDLYEAALGAGAAKNGRSLRVSDLDRIDGARAAGPKPLLDMLERHAGRLDRLPKIPSLALRLVRVAEGSLDIGLVSANSCDWDLAGADLILQEAGGRITGLDGTPLAYNQAEPIHGELAAAPSRLHPRVIEAMTTPSRPTLNRR
jgi:myo-inositol-1(or 4)-monophosphatase